MATVYRKRNSRVWYAQWRVFDREKGKWKPRQKSTGEANKDAAEDIVRQWQRNADDAAAMLGASRRGVRSYVLKGSMISDREKEILEAAMKADPSRDPRRKAAMWSEFRDKTLEAVDREDTRRSYRLCCDRWEKWCLDQERPLRFIDEADIQLAIDWRDGLTARGFRSKTVNFHLMAVGLVYQRALKLGMVPLNPFAAVKRVKIVPTKDNVPSEPYTNEQLERLYLAPYKVGAKAYQEHDKWVPGMAEEWELLIRITAVVGSRLADSVSLRWGNIDLEQGVIDYLPAKTSKTGKRIPFPIRYWPDQLALLRARFHAPGMGGKVGPDDPVYPLLFAAHSSQKEWMSGAFERVMRAAGIEKVPVVKATGKGRTRNSQGFHSLRHTANTNCAARGVPAEIRKELFGHSTVEMNRVYTHWDSSVLDELLIGKMK